jgi:hypothetical protein
VYIDNELKDLLSLKNSIPNKNWETKKGNYWLINQSSNLSHEPYKYINQ